MTPKNGHGMWPGPGRRLMTALAALAILALGWSAADSRRLADPAAPSAPPGSLAGSETRDAANPGARGLYAVPPSPFMHGSSEGSVEPSAEDGERFIRFSNGLEIHTAQGEPAIPVELYLESYGPERPGYYLVQFEGPIRESWKGMLRAGGAEILAYLPDYTYLVRLRPQDLPAVQTLSPVAWTGLYQPAYKVSAQPELREQSGRQAVVILLFPGETLSEVEELIVASGGQVLERTAPGSRNLLVKAEIDRSQVAPLARQAGVAWIEPWRPMELHNDRCQWVLQTWVNGNRKVWDNGITGQGQVISTSDTGILTTHNNFRDTLVPINDFGDYPTHRKIIAYWKTVEDPAITFGDHAQQSWHGTHTAGTTCGNDAPFGANAMDGMAKDAKTYFLDGASATEGIFVPIDMSSMLILPYNGNAGGAARIMSNSWGTDNGGAYDTQCMSADQFMWEHPDFLLFFSAGNAGPGTNTVGSPASAKNIVTAGGTGNGTAANTIYSGTSRGPTDDGRRKPTVCAPATLTSSIGPSQTSYGSLTGTSMASPAMAGAMLLARQYLADGWYPGGAPAPANAFTPSAALIKALAVNSGQNDISGFTVPDNNVGWGRIKLDDVLYFPGDTRHTVLVDDGDGLLTGQTIDYRFWVSDTSLPLRVSLVWTDYPGNPAASRQLVNNLHLRATGGGQTYLGNVFSGGQSTTGGNPDSLNVEECVWRTTPAAGLWTVRVEGANVPFGPQPFALVVSGGLGGNSGVVLLDRGAYAAGDTLRLRVEDSNAGGTVTVSVSSATETTPESVVLSPSLVLTGGVYEGSFPTTITGAAHADGQLSVSHGDVVTVTYSDTSPVHTATATASVVINPPAITGVATLDTGQASAIVGWTTSGPAGSRVYYGTTPALGLATTADPTLVTAHTHAVTGLSTATTYYYDVESSDHYGNTVRDDNGGAHYRFTTDDRGDILLVIGDESFTERDRYLAALARTGWTWDEWGEALALDPPVGDLASGLRSYRAIWWQVGWEQYPPFSDAARDSITKYNSGGGRLNVFSHDVAWDFGDPTAPDYSVARNDWLRNQLHVTWQVDPATWTLTKGIAGDPISGDYTANISYAAHRSGGAGDEIDSVPGSGTANYVWKRANLGGDDCAVRWLSGSSNGDPDSATWGGTPTKSVTNCFEWSRLNPTVADDVTRAGILDKTLLWLIGHDHPDVAVVGPNGGEVFVGTSVSVSWTEATYGAGVGSRRLEYSDDGGQSWALISASPGTSPYSWDISGVPNGSAYRVRLTLVDNATPTLSGRDASDADFTINRPGGDTRGPVMVAGSATISPNPARAPGNVILTATMDDSRTGGSNIAAGEWNLGAWAFPPGTGTAMSGTFTSPVVAVKDTIVVSTLPDGPNTLWIRGRDAAGNWGNAARLDIQVNGGATSVPGGEGPAVFGLAQNAPNPFNPETTIHFSLARSGSATLAIYDVSGRQVRRLVEGELAAGPHSVRWDGRDARGRTVASGIYFYRLDAQGESAVRKMALMK